MCQRPADRARVVIRPWRRDAGDANVAACVPGRRACRPPRGVRRGSERVSRTRTSRLRRIADHVDVEGAGAPRRLDERRQARRILLVRAVDMDGAIAVAIGRRL